jgi:uncharacterized protein YndB with AHSA1/START domain
VPSASSKTIIHAPADAIWRMISDFGAAFRYLAMVEDCSVAGQGVGSLRTLTNADGTTIVERLEALDEIAHRLSYALLTDTPFSNCLTTVSVRDVGPSQAEVTWSATFEADGIPESEAVALLEGAFELNSRALQHFLVAGAP